MDPTPSGDGSFSSGRVNAKRINATTEQSNAIQIGKLMIVSQLEELLPKE